MDAVQFLRELKSKDVSSVMLGLADIDGLLRGKYVDLGKFVSLLEKGGGFCDCVFGWDLDDQLYDQGTYTGWHTGFPDTEYRLIEESRRTLPGGDTPFFVGEFAGPDNSDHPLCPRSLLRRTSSLLANLGLSADAGFEYEFFVFRETSKTVREKNYHDLVPLSEGNFGYSVLRAASQADGFEGLLKYCSDFRMPLEGLHCETGPGVWEAAIKYCDVLEAADRANLFKTFSKVYFQRHDAIATFMAKWSMDFPGQSGHLHISLRDTNDEKVLHSESEQIPAMARYALGGLLKYLPEWLVLYAPTVNSYTRLVKGAWAPTAATWGIENRTCAVRFITGHAGRQHIELRVPGADANPYLAAAGAVGSILLGIQEKIEPPEPIVGNAYDVESNLDSASIFSPTLRDAASRFEQSSDARKIFGDEFVDHFVMSRVWESREAERHVNSWQLARYFEAI